MTDSRLNWGVLGTALIARAHVIPALLDADHCRLVAIGSRSQANADDAADEFGIPRAYGSYDELLADPDIDCVYLPLPNHLHTKWIIRAADAGKHILVEKPVTLTAAAATRVAAHCADRGVLVMEAFMYRFHPAWVKVRHLLETDTIGRVTDVAVWFSFRSTRPTDFRHHTTSGGGALYDVGCYAVDVSRMLLGDNPSQVLGTARIDPVSGVDLTFTAILNYGDATASFTCSMEQEPMHSVVIHGTAGWISIADPFNCPPHHETTITVGTGGNHHPHASAVQSFSIPAANQYALQATALTDAILAGNPSPVPITGSVANMRVIERLFAAAGMDLPSGDQAD